MGVILAEGLVLTLLVVTGLRQAMVRAVPLPLKRAIGIGIGLFLALIGFKSGQPVPMSKLDAVVHIKGHAGL